MPTESLKPGPSRPGFSPMKLCYGCAEYRSKSLFARSSRCCWCRAADASKRRATAHGCTGPHFTGREWEALVLPYGCCLCCGEAGIRLTVDHVIPLSEGGANTVSNIQPLCGPCNSTKGVRTVDYR